MNKSNNFVKQLFLTLGLVLLAAVAQAQTVKWTAGFIGTGAATATDGFGALAFCYYPFDEEIVRCVWLDANGRSVMTNDYPMGPSGGGVLAVTRFTRTELALQLVQQDGSHRSTNVLRRFKRTKSGVAISDTALDLKEQLDSIPTGLTDAKGFFTRAANTNDVGQTFRRYSN